MRIPTSIFLSLLFLATTLFTSGEAFATLGEGPDSVARDRKALRTVLRTTTTYANYTVQESTSSATTVREYLTPAGVVFAVAWNGVAQPDLTPLLGSYGDDYRTALDQSKRRRGQKRSHVQGNRVIVETWGHMRNMQGRAYVPELVPTGVTTNEIR